MGGARIPYVPNGNHLPRRRCRYFPSPDSPTCLCRALIWYCRLDSPPSARRSGSATAAGARRAQSPPHRDPAHPFLPPESARPTAQYQSRIQTRATFPAHPKAMPLLHARFLSCHDVLSGFGVHPGLTAVVTVSQSVRANNMGARNTLTAFTGSQTMQRRCAVASPIRTRPPGLTGGLGQLASVDARAHRRDRKMP